MTKVSLSLFILPTLWLVDPVAAAPGKPTLIAPLGNVVGSTIAFTWNSVPEAEFYYVFINGAFTSGASVMTLGYAAHQIGCADSPTCTTTLTPPVTAGQYSWRVIAWAAGETGPASNLNVFVVRDPVQNWGGKVADKARFSPALSRGAYLDNETGLVWDVKPATEPEAWASAMIACGERIVDGRKGFRLPTREELLTLVDPAQGPTLPAGHPFKLGNPLQVGNPNLMFWTQTNTPSGSGGAMVVDFFYGVSKAYGKDYALRYWCVRGPGGHAQ